MRKQVTIMKQIDYLSYGILYGCAYLGARQGYHTLSALFLIVAAFLLYILQVGRTKNLVDLRGIFALSWIGGEGIACFQLSHLQHDWADRTWLAFFLVYLCFQIGHDFRLFQFTEETREIEHDEKQAKRLLLCIGIIMGVSIACFLCEALLVGFIPLFDSAPHAYSHFHVSGVHYFTISCVLIPALTVLYTKVSLLVPKKVIVFLVFANITAAAIPILCVSRFQLLFAVGFAVVTYLMLYHKITWKMIVGLFLIMIPMYVLLTVARRHDVSYLNGIFEMKNVNTPIFITQPYMYIANNYENFNCMVEQLTEHSKGLKMLFPVFALSGLKFVFPELLSFPLYITKEELTTLTMFYDAYYDFGVIGIIVFSLLVGILAAQIRRWTLQNKNPITYLFYGQMAIYLGLSFFTTWFSNPTTWFWFVLTGLMYIGIEYKGKRKKS